MPLRLKIHPNTYKDSVSLMRIAADMEGLDGIAQASVNMATPGNLALIAEAGFLEVPAAGPNDLLVAARGDSETALDAAFDLAAAALAATGGAAETGERAALTPKSQQMALDRHPDANLTLISCPGDYAAAEAMKALRLGLNVMMFSDNVTIEDERALKTYAAEHDLLMMGPDCGTAIIQGLPLGFANQVAAGPVGIVGASGTGLQQVACLLDGLGVGLSHALGTGGHDLDSAIGGVTMSQGLKLLAADEATRVIVLISKPPAAEIAERLIDEAGACGKPVVVNFLGATNQVPDTARDVFMAPTLAAAAAMAADLTAGRDPTPPPAEDAPLDAALTARLGRLDGRQKFLCGLYSGGTFCYEAQLLLGGLPGAGHSVVDLGDDRFTQGRPHPMIDQRTRRERILREARDPGCAVLLLDVVLGHGAHPDPASELAETLTEAETIAAADGRHLIAVGFVCGTAGDPQGLTDQTDKLRRAGVVLAPSNAAAVGLARRIVETIGGVA